MEVEKIMTFLGLKIEMLFSWQAQQWKEGTEKTAQICVVNLHCDSFKGSTSQINKGKQCDV